MVGSKKTVRFSKPLVMKRKRIDLDADSADESQEEQEPNMADQMKTLLTKIDSMSEQMNTILGNTDTAKKELSTIDEKMEKMKDATLTALEDPLKTIEKAVISETETNAKAWAETFKSVEGIEKTLASQAEKKGEDMSSDQIFHLNKVTNLCQSMVKVEEHLEKLGKQLTDLV